MEDLTPNQQDRVNALVSHPLSCWPPELLAFIQQQSRPFCEDTIIEAVAAWVRQHPEQDAPGSSPAEDQQRYIAAAGERTRLRKLAWAKYKGNLEWEERRYQHELEHIERVFRLRTGTGEAPETAVTLCQYCGRAITQPASGRWTAAETTTYCPRSPAGWHSPA